MKQKDILLLIIPTCIFVCFWIFFSVFHSAKTSTISDIQSQSIAPISPDFDTKAVSVLKTREKVEPLFSLSVKIATPTPTINLVPVSSPSALSSGSGILEASLGGKIKP